MEMFIGLLIGAVGGAFMGMTIMALCVASSRDSRNKEEQIEEVAEDKMPVSMGEKGFQKMKINLFDNMIEFECDWKAVVGVGIIILGCVVLII